MAYNNLGDDLQFIGTLIDKKVDEQPKYREIANTITAAAGTAVTLAGQALLLPFDLPDYVMWIVLAITTLGTVLGVNNTKNGFTPSQVEKMKKWQAEYIDRFHTHGDDDIPYLNVDPGQHAVATRRFEEAEASAPTAKDLEDEVQKFNEQRFDL